MPKRIKSCKLLQKSYHNVHKSCNPRLRGVAAVFLDYYFSFDYIRFFDFMPYRTLEANSAAGAGVAAGHGAQTPHVPRCRLAMLGMEVGGQVSSGASAFLRRLARARARQQAPWAAEATRRSLQRRWMARASFAGLRVHASTLLELQAVPIDSSDSTEMPLGDLLAGAAGDEPTGDSRVR